MPELKLYSSNRLEILADRLAAELEKPLQSPLTPEIIIVQNNGMRRWLSLELSKRFGVWANCRYLFPNAAVGEIFQMVMPGSPAGRFFDVEIMAWRVMKILPECLDRTGFEILRSYIDEKKSLLRNYQLSSKIADTFDQYLTYRPEMIISWDSGAENHWQAELWRSLTKPLPGNHPPAMLQSFLKIINDNGRVKNISLPERISVFGISAIPKFHMDVFTSLSGRSDINLFLMNPSRQYWADIRSERSMARALKNERSVQAPDDLHMEKGNSLLASMGKSGRDFLWMILEHYTPSDFSFFEEPGEGSLLRTIQSDILDMIDRGSQGDEPRLELPEKIIDNDDSISINSCHSPLREVEALRDYILHVLNNNPDIGPHDIIVMTPDIETYSPFINAVFGDRAEESAAIPYSITDVSARREYGAVDAFMAILNLSGGRFEASAVLDVLEFGDVREKFGLSAADIETIRRWVIETNIRWGVNAAAKRDMGLPMEKQNTWSEGFRRLLLGYALGPENEPLYGDILPYDNIEGNEAGILGRFLSFFDSLRAGTIRLEKKYTPEEWRNTLVRIIDSMFQPEENNTSLQSLRNALNRLASFQAESGFDREIDLPVVKSYLEQSLGKEFKETGFLTGRVTFCTMLPMRSIPFRVVCLMGMNSDSFPRVTRTPGFNIIAQKPRRGDRSQRTDDRYLFLESIISAREKLYISYAGQNIQDNSEIPPSVVVSELLDYIDQGFKTGAGSIRKKIVKIHGLQPFSPKYFRNEGRLFSYSKENFNACLAMLGEKKEPAAFIPGELDGGARPGETVDIKNLLEFYRNPAKYIIKKKLGIFLEDYTGAIKNREPFELDGLDRYKIEQDLIGKELSGIDAESSRRLIRSSGILPPGNTGDALFSSLVPGVREFIKNIKPYIGDEKLYPIILDIKINGYTLTGEIDDIWKKGLVNYRYADVKTRDRLNTWIRHLAVNSAGRKHYSKTSYLFCRNSSWQFSPESGSADILSKLIELFFRGQNELLKFFPESSYEYARILFEKKSPDRAITKALSTWKGNDFARAEADDPYFQLCFNKINPVDKTFFELSEQIFIPLLKNQREFCR